jgi:ubiquinone/menaquinone biosynthesis C-methylase UbiE
MASRKFNWVSSSDSKNNFVLKELNSKMMNFYSSLESRNNYQQMVDNNDNDLNDPGMVTSGFINYLKNLFPKKVLEVGCGSGRIYQFIKKELIDIDYTGIEVSKTIIEKNRVQFPQVNWLTSDAYKIPFADKTFDVCFSFYVLEHLVFPEKALNEMMRIVKLNGFLILIFPDFSSSGRFASQHIGLSNEPTAISKLKKGRIIDALISLYDSRIRLPNALKNAVNKYGSFPVNIKPKCLTSNIFSMSPDIDAVYIASKAEIEKWAAAKGYKIFYPAGKEEHFSEHAFLSIQKIV